jgi:hypothetical protein
VTDSPGAPSFLALEIDVDAALGEIRRCNGLALLS